MEDEKQLIEQPQEMVSKEKKSAVSKFFAVVFYIAGAVLIGFAVYYLNKDLQPKYSFAGEYYFNEYEYVGGDAYNYIISAARSTAIMVKALIYAVLGCTSLISGRLSH